MNYDAAFKNIDDTLWKDAGCGSELDYIEQTSFGCAQDAELESASLLLNSDCLCHILENSQYHAIR